MEAVWGAVLSFLFILATLSGYGAGMPPEKSDKDKSEQSEKKDEDKDKKDSDKSGDKDKSEKKDKKDKSGEKDKGSSAKGSKKKAEYCIRDCPEAWRIRP